MINGLTLMPPPDLGKGTPTRKEREQLAETDDRADDATVVTLPTGAANGGYAYHLSDDEGNPLCGGTRVPTTEYIETTRLRAKRQGKSPCQNCERLIT